MKRSAPSNSISQPKKVKTVPPTPWASPLTNGSPIRQEQSSQVLHLIEELASARKEIDLQAAKIRELESELQKAREAIAPKKAKKAAVKKDLSLDIKSHEKALNKLKRDLKKAVRLNWHDGWQDQIEIECDIIGLVNDWQGEVFRAAIEKGERLYEVHEALLSMETWILSIKNNDANTRNDWDSMDSLSDMSVENAMGKSIYNGWPERILVKLWRDTALKAIVNDDQRTVDAIVELFKADHSMARESFRYIHSEDNEDEDGYPIEDEWYADDADMKNAVPVLKGLVNAK